MNGFGRALCVALIAVGSLAQAGCVMRAQGPAIHGDFHGQVVDADTGAPIAGAVVTVVWTKSAMMAFSPIDVVHRVREVRTDRNGWYRVDASPGFNWNWLKEVQEDPSVIIYKAGYGHYPVLHVSPRLTREQRDWFFHRPLLEGATVKLKREASGFGRFQGLSRVMPGRVPASAVPLLIGEINLQRKLLGNAPLPVTQ